MVNGITSASAVNGSINFIDRFLGKSPKQVFLVRKIVGRDAGTLYAMKVLKKATLKGELERITIFKCLY